MVLSFQIRPFPRIGILIKWITFNDQQLPSLASRIDFEQEILDLSRSAAAFPAASSRVSALPTDCKAEQGASSHARLAGAVRCGGIAASRAPLIPEMQEALVPGPGQELLLCGGDRI